MRTNITDFETFYSNQLSADMIPASISGKYKLSACLSMTEEKSIFLLSDKMTGKPYVLKKVSKKHSQQSENERDILFSLDHPSVPKLHKWFTDSDYTYLMRDFFDGITLDALIAGNGLLPEEQIIDLVVKICDLLIYLHRRKPPIIHRDIKPQNIVLSPNGQIGLIDFDASRRFVPESSYDTVYMGTLQTAAPEQFGYRQTNQRTDIYSLGIILIFLSTGSYDRAGILHMPSYLRKVAEKCTEFSPDDRYAHVEQVKYDLLHKKSTGLEKKKRVTFAILLSIITILMTSIVLRFFLPDSFPGAIPPAPEATVEPTVEPTMEPTSMPTLESTPIPTPTPSPIPSTATPTPSQVPNSMPVQIPTEPTPSVSSPTPSPAPTTAAITFQSPRIEQAVREALGKTNGEPLTQTDLVQVNQLYIIGDLTHDIPYIDIRHDYDARQISLIDKQILRGPIDTLADLEMLPFLNDLTLVYQQITDLSGIENLHLTKLNLAYNNITDLTPIKDMVTLSWLSIICNPIEDISPIKNLYKLGYLQICGTNVTDLSPLSDMQSLTMLDIYRMKDMDLSPLSALDRLEIIQ